MNLFNFCLESSNFDSKLKDHYIFNLYKLNLSKLFNLTLLKLKNFLQKIFNSEYTDK